MIIFAILLIVCVVIACMSKRTSRKRIDLQMFADAGTLVNATGNYVNAYTGDTISFDSHNTMNGELKTYYDTELLENARVEMYYAQFGKKQPLPANNGTTVEWRKMNTFERADRLVEGVIPTGQKFGISSKTGSIAEYGTYTTISDKLELRAYDDMILGATEEMGASAAETQEALIRDGLFVNTNVMYCDNITLETGAVASTPTTQAAMLGNSTTMSLLTPTMINRAVTKMKKDRVPRIRGKYVAVIHPSVAHDLREQNGWVEVHKYDAPTEIFNGEIGELHGVRFIENTFAPVLQGKDLASDTRTLKINKEAGYSGAITSVAFDGSTAGVANDELIGRVININGVSAVVTDNTTSTITFASTNFGSISDDDDIFPGEGAGGGVAAYPTYFFGKDAFGIIDAEGGALEMIFHDKGEIGGPLNQFSTIGYKFATNGVTILYPERVLRVMSCSSSGSIDVGT